MPIVRRVTGAPSRVTFMYARLAAVVTMSARTAVLARRARFVAAALGALAAAPALGCSPCLKVAVDCETGARRLRLVVPPTLCVGDSFTPDAVRDDPCGLHGESVTDRAVFATSDHDLVVFDGRTGYARGVGRVTLTVLEGGEQSSIEIYVAECGAAADSGPDGMRD